MKKVIALLSIIALVSCGGSESSSEMGVDSTQTVDSVKQDTITPEVDTVERSVEGVQL
jgi:hypothetical protein